MTFVKAHSELIELGLPVRLVHAYGVLEFMIGTKGECWPTQKTLAHKFGVKTERHVRRILSDLRRLKLITWKQQRYYCLYRVLKPDRQWIGNLIANPDRTRISNLTGRGSPVSDRTRMSDRKESSSSKRTTEKNPDPPKRPFPSTGASAAMPEATVEPAPTNSNASQGKISDDDDPNKTLEQRFEARLLKRHGATLRAPTVIKTVLKELADYPGVTFADFLGFDAERTTGTHFHNPGGYYRTLARECGASLQGERAAAHMAASVAAQDVPRDAKGNCAKCGGGGILKDRTTYCDACPIGRDLSRVAKRKPKSETTTGTVDYRRM